MRRSRVALFLFLGTFGTGLYTADLAPPPQGVAADYGRCGLAGPPPMAEDEGPRPDWCLPSPAIDALMARLDRRPADAAAAYAPASRKVAGRVRRAARPTPPVVARLAAPERAAVADLPTCMPQTPWSCPLALPLREAEVERGARPSLARRTMDRGPFHPLDLPRGEVLAAAKPRVLLGNLTALARDPRHSTGNALALRLNAEKDGLSRRVVALPRRDSYSRRYDYPFDYDCRMMRDDEATAGVECNADDTYAVGRGLAGRRTTAPVVASGIVREDLSTVKASSAAATARQLLALLAAGARLTRDAASAAEDWRVRLLAAVRSAAVVAPERATTTEAARATPPAYLGL